MRTRIEPQRCEWKDLCRRPVIRREELDETIRAVFEAVQESGDGALLALTEKYDGVKLTDVKIPIRGEKVEASGLNTKLRAAIDTAYENIRLFHQAQLVADIRKIATQPGVVCWREPRAIERVGLYVPGGSAPLISTMLMLGVPAQLAGSQTVVVCTPPDARGRVNPALRYAAAKCGVREVCVVGGAQAIAAMTFGTRSVAKVDKLFGPGNQYVTAAKEYAQTYGVAIDMLAGPSEVLVLADDTARAAYVAADLLSQAEHGPDSQVVLVTTSRRLQNEVKKELDYQIRFLKRGEIAAAALRKSLSVFFDNLTTAFDFANAYAPEHWILQVKNASALTRKVQHAGSVFVGRYTPESAGDYASGTNHTLPTGGWARSCSGVSTADFQKQVSFQILTRAGLKTLASAIVPLAEAEGLDAHKAAVTIRLAPPQTLNS